MIERDDKGYPLRTGWGEFDAACVLLAAIPKFEPFVKWEERGFDWHGMFSQAYAHSEAIYVRLALDLWNGNWDDEEKLRYFGVPCLSEALKTFSTLAPLHEAIHRYRPGSWPSLAALTAMPGWE
jgi:hypothetical protein